MMITVRPKKITAYAIRDFRANLIVCEEPRRRKDGGEMDDDGDEEEEDVDDSGDQVDVEW